jgi:hypothetical protein
MDPLDEPPNLLARIHAALPLILESDYLALLCLASELTLDARFPSQTFMDSLKQEQRVDVLRACLLDSASLLFLPRKSHTS